MKLSMFSATISRRRETFDLRRMLKLTRELDLAGVDFITLHDRPPAELRRLADDHGVPVVCHTFFSPGLNQPTAEARRQGREDCARSFEAAAILGAPRVMLATPGREDRTREESRANYLAGLREIEPQAKAAGLTLMIENFGGPFSPFVTAADFRLAVAAVPDLKLNFDNGNAATGEDPVKSLAATAEWVEHVHFKDWNIRPDPAEGFRKMLDGRHYRSALIGEGDLDQRGCLKELKRAGYAGCISLEYENDDYDPYEATRRAAEHLRVLAAEIGY